MKHKNDPPGDAADEQRRETPAVADHRGSSPAGDFAASPEETQRAFHELRRHQVELETQNTELRRTQAELLAARARYFDLYDLAPVGYCTLSREGLILEANLTLANLLRVARPALVKQPISRFILKDDWDAYYLHHKEILETGTTQARDLRMTTGDGAQFWAHLETAAAEATARALTVRLVIIDITARVRAEGDLRENEERYALALRGSEDGLWDWNLATNDVVYSTRWKSMLGYAEDEVKDHLSEWERLVHAEDRSRALATVRDFIDGKLANLAVEMRMRHKDGRWVHVLSRGGVVRDQDGRPVRLVGTHGDITDRKQAEAALRESERRFSAVLENMSLIGVMLDTAGRITFCNDHLLNLTGWTRGELLGQSWFDCLLPPDIRAEVRDEVFVKTIAAGELPVHHENEIVTRQGERRLVSWNNTVLRDRDGLIVGAASVGEDISERRRAEAALRDSNRRLEEAGARIAVAVAEAERANAAKSEFLANMSHEIRTPMNGVIGMTDLLLDTELNEEQRRYADIVRSSGEALLSLLNDILDFSKIEAGKLDIETLDFDLRALLDDFAATVALRVQEKGIEFICAAAPDVPAYLRGDPGRLRQVLTNLTGNAIKFTQNGEIAVRAGLLSETDDEAFVRFSIKDTGIGIAPEKQALLFQKFTQADASTTRKYGGTGLGLAISKQLAAMMGGEIGITSEEGHGSEFWFTARFTKQTERAQTESLPLADIRGTHLLIVDDNATHREVLMAQLRAWGVRSEEASDGALALRELHRAKDAGDPFQVAIVDMQMPVMDGAALARSVKAEKTLQDTRLVLLTSMGQRGDARKMEEIGFAAYLTKPVRQDEIIGCLSVVLGGAAVAEPARPIVTRHAIRELRHSAARILLVEDNITNQQVAVGLLERLGLRADAVANGAEAVKALETLPYDLVLMDVQMPVLNGLEATRQIRDPRSAVRNHEIPIIAMTASAMQSDRDECLDAGMNDYVSKPVSREALAEALETWLPEETAATPEQAPPASERSASVFAREPETLVFDKIGLLDRIMGDGEFARVLVEGYLDDIPKQIETLKDFVKADNAAGVGRQAHTIKGAAANMGGEALRAVACTMEESLESGSLEAAAAHLPELERQSVRLRKALEQFLVGTAGGSCHR